MMSWPPIKIDPAEIEELKRRMLWISVRAGTYKHPGLYQNRFASPRDWSPRIAKWKERLEVYRKMVPSAMLVPAEEVAKNCTSPGIVSSVLAGTAFVIKIKGQLELVDLSPWDGKVVMTDFMEDVFRDLSS